MTLHRNSVEVSFADILSVFREAWIGVCLLIAIGGVVAFLFAASTKPVYRSKVLVAPNVVDNSRASLSRIASQLAPLANMVGAGIDGGFGGSNKDIWIATLKSRRLTESFIVDRGLAPMLLGASWSEAEGKWKAKDGSTFVPSIEKAVRTFDVGVRTIVEDRKTGVITLSIDWQDPKLAADWANDLIRRANDFIRTRTIEESERGIKFLEAELRKTEILELRQAIYSMIESRINSVIMARVRSDYAFLVIDPATVSEPNYFIWPRKRLMTAIGLLCGFGFGVIYAIGRKLLSRVGAN